MIEQPEDILKGLALIAKILGVNSACIAIEDNKPHAVEAMRKALQPAIKIVVLKTKYPQGAEKQLIKRVLGRTVPAGGLPMDVGCVVQNVGTALAVYEAVYLGSPLIERALTITGACVREPVNIWVRIGTVLNDLKDSFGGFIKEPKRIV